MSAEDEIPTSISVTAAIESTCHLATTCWGENVDGRLGDGTTVDKKSPVNAIGANDAVSISGTGFHNCVLTDEGGVKCWGAGAVNGVNNSGSLTPVPVAGLASGVVAVSAGRGYTCVITTAGAVKCWGVINAQGQLGNGSYTASPTVGNVVGLASGVKSISTNRYHACAVTAVGALKCWGDNTFGQLGNASVVGASNVPVAATDFPSGVAYVTTEWYRTCAHELTGQVFCFGAAYPNSLRDASAAQGRAAQQIPGLESGIKSMSSGRAHTCVVTNAGGAKCWGENEAGQLGNNSTVDSAIPVNVSGLTSGVKAIAAGGSHTCAQLVAGGIRCWGANGSGQLGNGTTTASLVPVTVTFPTGPCPGPTPNIALGAGATGHVFCGTDKELDAPGAIDNSVSAVFWWSNPDQQFKFWFRGFPDNFQTLTGLVSGRYYFFQAPAGGGTIANAGGSAPLAAIGGASLVTNSGANGVVWSGTNHPRGALGSYSSIQAATAIFQWDNAGQAFDFWFRGFPDAFQTLSPGIQRGGYYFFQAPGGQTIVMD